MRKISEIKELREVINALVPMLAQKGLVVTQQGTQAYVRFNKDGVAERVNIPYLPDEATEELVIAIHGFIDHEVAHVLFTDHKVGLKERSANPHLQGYWNIIEDCLIEKLMGEKFPGSKSNLTKTQGFFLEKISQPMLDKAQAAKDVDREFNVIAVPALRALSGQSVMKEFMDAGDYWEQPRLKEVMGKLPADFEKKLKALRTTKDSFALAQALYDAWFAKPPAPPAAPPALSPPSEPEDSDGDDEKSDDPDGEGSNIEKPEDEDDKGSGGDPAESDDEDEKSEETDAGEKEDGDEKDGDDKEPDAGEGDDEPTEEDGEESADEKDAGEDVPDESEGDDEDAGSEEPGDEDAAPADDDEQDDDGAEDKGSEDEAGDLASDDGAVGSAESDAAEDDSSDEVAEGDDEEEGEEGEASEMESDRNSSSKEADLSSPPPPPPGEDPYSKALGDIVAEEVCRQTKTADYRRFSRDYDDIKPYRRELDPKGFEKFDSETRAMIAPMQKDLERMIAARQTSMKVPGFRSGRLHQSGLHKLAVGDTRVFRRRFDQSNKATAVTLLIDNSGSMSGEPIKTAMSAGYALAQTLERINVPCEVLGFSTGSTPTSVRAEIRASEAAIGRAYTHYDTLTMKVFKDFKERMTPGVKQSMGYMAQRQEDMASNGDGDALLAAGERLLRRPEERKILIVLSDGQPAVSLSSWNLKGELHAHLHMVIADLAKNGVETFGIGIDSDAVRDYYPRHVVIREVSELPGIVMGEMKKMLMK